MFDVDFNEAVSGLSRRPTSASAARPPAARSTRHRRLRHRLRRDRHRLPEGTVTVTFAANGATDTAGNTGPNAQTDGPSVLIDRTSPTATIDLQAGSDSGTSTTDNITNAASLTFDVDFNEAVFGLAAADFSDRAAPPPAAVVGAPIGSGASYDVTLTGCSEGTVILRLAAGGVTDTAGNANAQTDGPTVTIDRTGPTATIDLQAGSDSGISTTDNITKARAWSSTSTSTRPSTASPPPTSASRARPPAASSALTGGSGATTTDPHRLRRGHRHPAPSPPTA